MRFKPQSRIWPALTVPILVACLGAGIALLVSLESGRRTAARSSACEGALEGLSERLLLEQTEFAQGRSIRGGEGAEAVRRSWESLPPNCLGREESSKLETEITAWIGAASGGNSAAET